MLTLDQLTNQRLKTRQRNRQFIYSMGAIFGLLGILLGSGWLFIPNIVPWLAGSALLIGSPLTVFLFGLAGIALGLFLGKQAINLGRSLLHIIHAEKPLRSWMRVGVALVTAAIMIPLLTTAVLPIAATGFAATAIAITTVALSISAATFLAKHSARIYSAFTAEQRDINANKVQSHIATNPYKQMLDKEELTNFAKVDPRRQVDANTAIVIQNRINQKIRVAKYFGDVKAEMEAKAARDLLHMAGKEDKRTDLAGAYLAGVKEYGRRIAAAEEIHQEILSNDIDQSIRKQADQAKTEAGQEPLVSEHMKDVTRHLEKEKAASRLIREAKAWLFGIYPKERSWLASAQSHTAAEHSHDQQAFSSLLPPKNSH